MRNLLKPIAMILFFAVAFRFAWPVMQPHLTEFAVGLGYFKNYCIHHQCIGDVIYILATFFILVLGLPLSTAAMLLAGVIFSFWEATTLVMVCRYAAAMLTFLVARHMWSNKAEGASSAESKLSRVVGQYPAWSVLLIRLAPLPDSVVNYSMATSPIPNYHYAVMSLVGMIPFTLFCVWIGQNLGSVHAVINYLQ